MDFDFVDVVVASFVDDGTPLDLARGLDVVQSIAVALPHRLVELS